MKICSIIGLLALSVLIRPLTAMGLTIDDTDPNAYWGGLIVSSLPSSVDVIGANFALDGMNVAINGTTMTVQVIGPYFSHFGSPNNDGDLYISSTGWHVSDLTGNSPGSKYYSAYDTFKDDGTEGWDYVVGVKQVQVVFGRTRSFVAVPGVYKLDFMNSDYNKLQFTTTRALQAYRGGYGDFVEAATITPDYAHNMLTYTFDTSFLTNPDNPGFHWTMYCGNDVVEGEGSTRVPEPASLLLLWLGLAGLCVYRRRTVRKIA
jgi:hypothetical protein